MEYRSRKKRKISLRKAVSAVLTVLFAACFCFAAFMLISELSEDNRQREYYADIVKIVEKTGKENDKKTDGKQDEQAATTSDDSGHGIALKDVDFDALWDINKDVVAWLTLPDTIIDYPVAQGETNDTYIRSLLNGEYHRFGTLFIDSGNAPDFSDYNTVIYGHHIKAGDMFGILEEYKDQDFYDAHPYFILYTPDAAYVLEPYANGYISDNTVLPMGFSDDRTQYGRFISDAMSGSSFSSHVDMDENYNTVTLYTCAGDDKEQRFVLYCRMREIG